MLGGGGGGGKLCHDTMPSPLSLIMQKGKKNARRGMPAWDQSFVKLDMPYIYTHIIIPMVGACPAPYVSTTVLLSL